jgi:hypothetical protein
MWIRLSVVVIRIGGKLNADTGRRPPARASVASEGRFRSMAAAG